MTVEIDLKKRYIDIDGDTRVGYNYLKQQFYVTNKSYTTYRDTVDLIEVVLATLGITEDTYPEVIENLPALQSTYEELYKVYYTIQDTGAYIHTIQFNDHEEYPLTIDCEKGKLYIMNTSIIYDLTVNESARSVRVPRILSYYRDTLGLVIEDTDMYYFYSLLVSYYYPTCYNQVGLNEDTNEYFYNNKFLLSNYSGTSPAVYNCTYNPNNNAPQTMLTHVIATDSTNNTITTSTPIAEESLLGYNKVRVAGTQELIEGTEYTADGTYTIDNIEDTTITVTDTIPFTYTFSYKECYVVDTPTYTISSMDATGYTITLSAIPTNLKVGDVIIVTGATVTTPYETISCNGSYTISQVGTIDSEGVEDKNTIIVEEPIPTDFTGAGATLIKEVFISNISTIEDNTITLTDTTELNLTEADLYIHTIENEETTMTPYKVAVVSYSVLETNTNNTIVLSENVSNDLYIGDIIQLSGTSQDNNTYTILNIQDNIITVQTETPLHEFSGTGATITRVPTNTKYIKVTENIPDYDYEDTCPVLYLPIPDKTQDTEVLIDVTSVSDDAKDIFPTGEFLTDTYEQCIAYINTLASLPPSATDQRYIATIKDNLYKKVPEEITLQKDIKDYTKAGQQYVSCSLDTMYLKGLYSHVYNENT